MYPDSYETFTLLDPSTVDSVGDDMDELNTKLDTVLANLDLNFEKYMFGKMEIHDDVMDIYDTDGNIIRTFNLFDINGNPTTTAPVYKREIKL